MKKIGIIQISSKRYGGIVYNKWIKNALSGNFEVDFVGVEPKYFKDLRYLKIPELLICLSRLKGERDLWIRDFYSILTLPFDKTKGKNLAVLYHVDFSGFPLIAQPFLFLLERFFFYRHLRKADFILTISEYWKKYFLSRGYPNVYKIYCGFDLNDFNISEEEVMDFKKKYQLEGKPIIYLGNCQKAKGVVGSYKALKDLDAYLVTSSRRQANVPTLNFNLNYRDYLKLLKASSVVVAMSKFKEGWCITAHEAMLCKTPVIGSGLGGMGELLENGRQIICRDFRQLRGRVEYLLERPDIRKKMGEDGYNYGKNFTIERFNKEWQDLIRKII